MAKKNHKQCDRMCETCVNFIPIGKGDHICDASAPVMVLEDYTPTDKYYWCKGEHWEEM
ncbi:MAG TPA: hypothetical protein H9711_08025 [Candidatus Mediterraneibacter intestinavium]|nr:hypothetical protein [Candidatus Mediterraneibacter intestinavium]